MKTKKLIKRLRQCAKQLEASLWPDDAILAEMITMRANDLESSERFTERAFGKKKPELTGKQEVEE